MTASGSGPIDAKERRDGKRVVKFTPGKSVVLYSEDGAEIKATPFFFSTVSGGGLSVELYAENGDRLDLVDAERGVYSLADPRRLLYLIPSRNA